MQKFQSVVNTRITPQSQPVADMNQVENRAGGFVFEITPWEQFKRFLILGTENGSYYATERELTLENAEISRKVIEEKGIEAVDEIVRVSVNGLAAKNDAAIFALALAASSPQTHIRKYALSKTNEVLRIGTHLFQFVAYCDGLRGTGRLFREALGAWYRLKTPEQLAYQVIKYKNRMGWTHGDVLRLCHVTPPSSVYNDLYAYLVGKLEYEPTTGSWLRLLGKDNKQETANLIPGIITAHEKAMRLGSNPMELCKLIDDFKLTHEMIPNEAKTSILVWDALLPHMPLTAIVRNLGKMTSVGLLKSFNRAVKYVREKLNSREYIKASRLHPISILTALKQYAAGKGDKGALTWEPVQVIVDALNDAFYLAFDNVTPVNKNIRLSLDVSGSMGFTYTGSLTARDITAAFALVTAVTEPNYEICMFSNTFKPLAISPKMRLDDVVRKIADLPFAATDCALPMVDAVAQHNHDIEYFIIYTDNETWYGDIHPFQALQQYRSVSGQPARLCVCATVPTDYSIANPNDKGMLDISGFSTDTPALIGMFGRGEI